MDKFTEILHAVERGDHNRGDELFHLVYDELRQLAAAHMRQERSGQTLQATALVHEAYLRLTAGAAPQAWANRRHFFGAAAEAMRRILIERARRKAAACHGGGWQRIELDQGAPIEDERSSQLVALDEALTELEHHDAQAAQLVKLRYFAGMSHQEAAATLNIGRRAADRLWALAKAWLYKRIQDGG